MCVGINESIWMWESIRVVGDGLAIGESLFGVGGGGERGRGKH